MNGDTMGTSDLDDATMGGDSGAAQTTPAVPDDFVPPRIGRRRVRRHGRPRMRAERKAKRYGGRRR